MLKQDTNALNAPYVPFIALLLKQILITPALNNVVQMVNDYELKVLNFMMICLSCAPTVNAVKPLALLA